MPLIVYNKGALKPLKFLEITFLVLYLFVNSDSFHNCISDFSNGIFFFFFDCTKFGFFDQMTLFSFYAYIFKLKIFVAKPKEDKTN